MSRLATIEIHDDALKFSAGHLMHLSSTVRETMHGHDYKVSASFMIAIKEQGMNFDCRVYKEKMKKLCEKLDYHFILPGNSPYLKITKNKNKFILIAKKETLTFAKKDAIILPITNVTLEELSYWFLSKLLISKKEILSYGISSLIIKVTNGRGESGASEWQK